MTEDVFAYNFKARPDSWSLLPNAPLDTQFKWLFMEEDVNRAYIYKSSKEMHLTMYMQNDTNEEEPIWWWYYDLSEAIHPADWWTCTSAEWLGYEAKY